MAKVHRSYRLEGETVEKVTAWAEGHGMTVTQAMEELLTRALESDTAEGEEREEDTARAEEWQEQKRMLGEHVRDLRANISTLTAQLAEKDRQIAGMLETVEHSQMLTAAHVAGALQISTAHDGTQNEAQGEAQANTQPRGIWAWLARKIDGR